MSLLRFSRHQNAAPVWVNPFDASMVYGSSSYSGGRHTVIRMRDGEMVLVQEGEDNVARKVAEACTESRGLTTGRS